MADYRFRFRHPFTLRVIRELSEYVSVNWRRHFVEGGDFELTVKRGILPDLPDDAIFEVLRDDQHEFAGVVRRAEYNPEDERWTISGLHVTSDFLSQRVVNPRASEFVTVSGVPAETALKTLVADQLLDPNDEARDLRTQLQSPCDFEIAASAGTGLTIDYGTRWISLYDACVEIANAGHVGHEVVLTQDSKYRYDVRPQIDATATVVFSMEQQENVAEAKYSEDRSVVANAVYALGDGEGAARLVELVEDTPDLAGAFRRERVIDERDADSTAALQMAALTHIAQSLADASSATFTPLLVSGLEYRSAWDIGSVVSVAFPEIGKTAEALLLEVDITVERRGEAVRVAVGQRESELVDELRRLFGRGKRAQLI